MSAPPPTHTVTINIYHFKGSVAHRPPLVHPDCSLELICTPTVPLRAHATTVCMGSEAQQVLKPPPPAPCMAKKATCCTKIHTVRLSDTHWLGLHTSWVLWPSVRRAAMAIFSGSELQKNRISYRCTPDARPRGCAYCSKGSAHMPTAWEGVPGWLGQQGVTVKKTYDIVGQTYDIVCQHTMSMFNTTSHITIRYRIPDIRYRISKNMPTISYTICTQDVVCKPPTTSYVSLNLRYRMRYVFLVIYDIVCTWYDIVGQSTILW